MSSGKMIDPTKIIDHTKNVTRLLNAGEIAKIDWFSIIIAKID
jgi:hypothetical protein